SVDQSPHKPPHTCASACARPPRSRSCTPSLQSKLTAEADLRRTNLSRGGATLLSSHAGDPRAATGDKTNQSQARTGRQDVSESARRQPEDLPNESDITDHPNHDTEGVFRGGSGGFSGSRWAVESDRADPEKRPVLRSPVDAKTGHFAPPPLPLRAID